MPSLSPENLSFFRAALPLLLFVHFSVLGVMLAAVSAAVVFDSFGRIDQRPHCRDLSIVLVLRTVPSHGMLLLPMLTAALVLLCAQLGYHPLLPARIFATLTLAPLLFGLAALAGYRRLLPSQRGGLLLTSSIGAAGVLLALASCFLLCCGAGLLVMPERWVLVTVEPRVVLSWVGIARFLEFTSLSLSSAGALILLIAHRPAGGEKGAGYLLFLRRTGTILALVFLLAYPAGVLLKLANLPAAALSGAVYAEAASSLAAAAAVALLLFEAVRRENGLSVRTTLILFAVLFALWILGDHLARENALTETTVTGVEIGGAAPAAAKEPAEAKAPPGGEKEEKGREIFERVCSRCHRFDEKLIGPPLDTVIPKYRQDIEALKSFIRQPVKKNPEYPAMPPPGLKDDEIDAVVHYLLARPSPGSASESATE